MFFLPKTLPDGAPGVAIIVSLDREYGVAPGSAIVTRSDEFGRPLTDANGNVEIWFEGNVNGAANLTTFIDKTRVAVSRMMDGVPTIAKMVVPAAHIIHAARFDLETMTIEWNSGLNELGRWAGEDLHRYKLPYQLEPLDQEAYRKSVDLAGMMKVSADPLVFQAGNGAVIVPGHAGMTDAFHPQSPLLHGWIANSSLPEDVRTRLIGSEAAAELGQARADVECMGEAVLTTCQGRWVEITNKDQAEAAGRLTKTGIGFSWTMRNQALGDTPDPHRWFVLLGNPLGKRSDLEKSGLENVEVGLVCVAALSPGETEIAADRMPLQGCHVAGHYNLDAYERYQVSLEQLAAQTGVEMYPNHEGRPYDQSPSDRSVSPSP